MTRLRNVLTGTFPGHLHCNAMRADAALHGRQVIEAITRELADAPAVPKVDSSTELEVVTFSTYQRPTLVERSLERFGVRPTVLGRGLSKWKNRYKIDLAIEHCAATSRPFVFLTDGSDAIFLRHPMELLAEFKLLDVPILMSLEKNSSPRLPNVESKERIANLGPYCYGNSGGLIGERNAVLKLLSLAQSAPLMRYPSDDQGRMRAAALVVNAKGDARCQIFQTLFMAEPGEFALETNVGDQVSFATHDRPSPANSSDVTAIVVCVDYDDYLAITLPRTLAAVDRVFVVTKASDDATHALCRRYGVPCFDYDAFDDPNNGFDKAGALNFLLERIERASWVLSLDADIVLTSRVEMVGQDCNSLYTAHRRMIESEVEWAEYASTGDATHFRRYVSPLRAADAYSKSTVALGGYFQLWHCPTCPDRRFPPSRSRNAASYDKDFARHWPTERRRYVHFDVLHLGINRSNWNGRRTPRWRKGEDASGSVCSDLVKKNR